ncbi:MAG: DUF222 domain-containing protein [Acidimicrobiia bacterium]|jgi:hypothetical protein
MPGAGTVAVDAREDVAVLPTERLEAEITELAGQLAAGECRWLLLVAEFDRREAWRQWGCRSVVHWLGWQCGLDARSARERVRVARALLELSAVREAFAAGALSYSKVRAITRIATPETEFGLVETARHATAAHIERIAAAYRRVFDPARQEAANRAHEQRGVDWCDGDDGFAARVRATHDDGAALRGALQELAERSLRDRPLEPGETVAQRRAHVLVEVVVRAAQGEAAADGSPTSPADRHLVVVNVDASVLATGQGAVCELDGGPGLAAETARRIACDAEIVGLVRDADLGIVGIGRASRRPPRWLRRRLHARDRGCRFPGCAQRRVVSAHHVEHWTQGGATDLENLVELCRFHHRLVHEGGWRMTFDGVEAVRFESPDGFVAEDHADGGIGGGSAEPLAAANARRGVEVTAETIISRWCGERLDLDLAITALTPRVPRHRPART